MSHKPYPMERILACATYASLGWVGAGILILQALGKFRPTHFVMYHIMQSIFIILLYIILGILCSLLVELTGWIPLINNIPILLNSSVPMLFGLSIIQACVYTIFIYLILSSLGGYYSYLPWVSNIIKYWVRK